MEDETNRATSVTSAPPFFEAAVLPLMEYPYPLLAVILTLVSFGADLALIMTRAYSVWPLGWTEVFLLGALVIGIVAAFHFPVQVHGHGKLVFSNVPLFLLAVLLPPPVAAVASAVAMAFGSHSTADIKSKVHTTLFGARWGLFALGASAITHAGGSGVALRSAVLFGAAATMFLADVLTVPMVLKPGPGETGIDLITGYVRITGLPEVGQYLVAILGAAAAASLPWSPVLLAVPISILYLNSKRTQEVQRTTTVLLENMADAVDLRDAYTGGHSRRVTQYVERTLTLMGISGPEAAMILSAARVHDIGKIGVPDSILQKPSALTDDERAIMAEHPEAGANLLARHEDFARGVEIVRHHHEAWDGSGYPAGLKGRDIPLGARILAIADGYDAMTSDRPYRVGMSPQQAMAILRSGRGRQWDAEIVDLFLTTVSPVVETRSEFASQATVSLLPAPVAA